MCFVVFFCRKNYLDVNRRELAFDLSPTNKDAYIANRRLSELQQVFIYLQLKPFGTEGIFFSMESRETHTTLSRHLYNVHNVVRTLYEHQRDVVYVLGGRTLCTYWEGGHYTVLLQRILGRDDSKYPFKGGSRQRTTLRRESFFLYKVFC